MSLRRLAVGPLLVSLCACNALSGVGDYSFDGQGAAASGGAGATGPGGSATGGTGAGGSAAGGGGGCLAPDKVCDEVCVSSEDPAFGCDSMSCEPCGVGEACCGGCKQIEYNPKSCGGCSGSCDDDEYCNAGSCECRPELAPQGEDCIDPLSDPNVCGSDGPCGGATPNCENGACVAACSGGLTNCSGACVDTSNHPLYCGSCIEACDNDKVCAGGECEEYRAAPGCSACPCDDCEGDFDTCCTLPASTLTICIKEDSCP